MLHSLAHQGISQEAYLQIAGREEDEIVEESKEDAEQALRREAVLAAIVEAEGSSRPRRRCSRRSSRPRRPRAAAPKKLLERLKSAGRLDPLKEDLAQRKALDLVAESAKPIPIEQAQARDKLWTPGAEPRALAGQLWTPGPSREAGARLARLAVAGLQPVSRTRAPEAKRSEDREPTRTDGR